MVFPIKSQKDSSGKIILDGNVLLGNISCVSKARLGAYITKLSREEMNAIDGIIALSLGILHHYKTLQHINLDQKQHLNKLQEQNALLQATIVDLQKNDTICKSM